MVLVGNINKTACRLNAYECASLAMYTLVQKINIHNMSSKPNFDFVSVYVQNCSVMVFCIDNCVIESRICPSDHKMYLMLPTALHVPH